MEHLPGLSLLSNDLASSCKKTILLKITFYVAYSLGIRGISPSPERQISP